jgi:hypothetical protein
MKNPSLGRSAVRRLRKTETGGEGWISDSPLPFGDDLTYHHRQPTVITMSNQSSEPVSSAQTQTPPLATDRSQPWYIPTSQTLFPVKKSEYKPPGRTQGHVSSSIASQRHQLDDDDQSTPTKDESNLTIGGYSTIRKEEARKDTHRKEAVEETSRRDKGHKPFRTRDSLEVQISEIENTEIRRLTALAYLS